MYMALTSWEPWEPYIEHLTLETWYCIRLAYGWLGVDAGQAAIKPSSDVGEPNLYAGN